MITTNLFKISNFIMQFKDSKQLELMVTASNIPGLTLGELTLSRPVVRDLRSGDSLTFDELSITALCDEAFGAYKEIYSYIISAANPFNANIDVTYPIFDSTLFLTTNKNNIKHEIKFFNCFFKSIGGINLNSSSNDETPFTFDIALGYSYYLFNTL